jgi:site-specific recombinase XerD
LLIQRAHKRSYGDDVIRMEKLLASFRGRSAESITPRELERHLAQTAEENDWAAAMINRYRAWLSLVYPLGIENGKVKDNPAVRWLSGEEETRLRALSRQPAQSTS